ncbi:MAG: TonB-dependent receptor plug domain-containing protein, partial [Bacteroidota bacterium]
MNLSTRFVKLLAILLSIAWSSTAYAQPSGGPEKLSRANPPSIQLLGKVMDGDSEQALEFATVTLFSKKDSSIVAGTITDEKGKFEFDTRPGRFFAKIEFISYKAIVIEDIPFERGKQTIDLGVITLLPDATTLAEVEVQAERSEMQMMLDKRVFNVGKDLANMGGSAIEILDNVPSVAVDVEGNVSLRGGAVRILVNGKPSGLVNADNMNGLQSIPANLIERVEVITNPSARYEAEGMTGIINIVLKKERKKGVNGSFDVNVGYPDNYGAAINMNFRRNKFNFFTNYGIRYNQSPGIGSNRQEFMRNDTLFFTDIDRDSQRGGLSNNIRFGADYFFTDKDILTASFLYSRSNDDNLTNLRYDDYAFSRENRISIAERVDDEA